MIEITKLDQINMLIKHANRNNIVINRLYTVLQDGSEKGNSIIYADCQEGYFTIYCFIENADYLFKLIQ